MRYLFLLMFLSGCFTSESSTPVIIKEPTKYEVRAGQWTSCWETCGKKDNLLSVTETACICRDGKRFVHAFAVEEPKVIEAKEVEKPKEESRSVFDMLKSLGD